MGMNGIFHYISHCDHICFFMQQGCHNRFVVSMTKKGEKIVDNIKSKTKVFFYTYCQMVKIHQKNHFDKTLNMLTIYS